MGYLIDLHCHTRDHSYDGKVPAADIVKRLYKSGFHGVVFTDHNYVWKEKELEAVRAEAGVPREFTILSGQEVRTSLEGMVYGDLLVYGLREALPDGTSPIRLFRMMEGTEAFCIAPHPAVPRIGFGEHVGDFPVLGIETWNGRYGNKFTPEAKALAKRHDIAPVGGSDAHAESDIGGGGTMFEERPGRLVDIARQLRSGAAKPWKPGRFRKLFTKN